MALFIIIIIIIIIVVVVVAMSYRKKIYYIKVKSVKQNYRHKILFF